MTNVTSLVLASGSATRRKMLQSAGVAFEVDPARIDEDAVRDGMMSSNACVDPEDIAMTLAVAKALDVSQRRQGVLVLGSDQVLALGARIFSKPASLADARQSIETLNGRRHHLFSAAALARDGEVVWQVVTMADMTMRRMSDAFIASYLDRVGERVCHSVGAYEFEGLGAQLFERVEGDYFTILGLPLLQVLDELRRQEILQS